MLDDLRAKARAAQENTANDEGDRAVARGAELRGRRRRILSSVVRPMCA